MLFKRKDKAMAPQTETVELPDIIEPVQETDGWMFPKSWSDEDKRDWLVTHPLGVETVTIADPPPAKHYDDCAPECEGDLTEDDRDEYEKKFDEQPPTLNDTPAMGPEELKANGTYAAAIAVPPDMRDTVNADNYDPRQFILVHEDVFMNFVEATHSEAELGLENKELRKRVNALTRGMRKVNKHWSATKRELKEAVRQNTRWAKNAADVMEDLENLAEADRKRATIFATRLARRLRKARAGRDKRERQLNQANATIATQDHIIESQASYIDHLEALINGARR